MKKHSIKDKTILFISALLSIFILFLLGCSIEVPIDEEKGNNTQVIAEKKPTEVLQEASDPVIKLHFIDVGQADSILVQQGSSTMLIDAGNNDDSDLVVNYLRKNGVKKIDYLVGTHPHEDHIGGIDKVIEEFDIGKIYMPKATSNTKTYEDVLKAIKAKKLKISSPTPGTKFNIGDAECTIFAPNGKEYEDLNEYSVVIKVVYKESSFMLTGDAEGTSEKEMIAKGFDLSADVLKLGHHGSGSSSTKAFLDKVNPKYAIVSAGKDNDYGHPHRATMDKMKSRGIKIYRTDERGTIVCTSDGMTIKFNVKPGSYLYGKSKK